MLGKFKCHLFSSRRHVNSHFRLCFGDIMCVTEIQVSGSGPELTDLYESFGGPVPSNHTLPAPQTTGMYAIHVFIFQLSLICQHELML